MAINLIKRIRNIWTLSDPTPIQIKEKRRKKQASIISPNPIDKVMEQIKHEQE